MEPTFQHVLERLYASGIEVSIESFRDEYFVSEGWSIAVADELGRFVGPPRPFVGDTALEEAAEWLIKTTIELHPDSDFAKEFGADAA